MTTETTAKAAPAASEGLYSVLALTVLLPSPTQPRKRFDEAALKELAETIRVHGVLQPILVRAIAPEKIVASSGKTHEIVAGERRYRASKLAGKTTIPVILRVLTDAEVVKLQMLENLQREDLHPIEEAEGYQRMLKDHGYTVPMLVKDIGKSREYIYARLKLTALCQGVRDVFFKGEIHASVALLIARIPVDKLQLQALKEIQEGEYHDSGPLSYRQAADLVRDNYMLDLKKAPFDRKAIYFRDPAGMQAIDACATCPKRTGNSPELFPDVKDADVCTDPECFSVKRDAHFTRVRQEAVREGKKVIAGAEAKKLIKYESSDPAGYITESDLKQFWTGDKHTNLVKGLGAALPEPVLIENPHNKELITAYPEAAIAKAAKDKGLIKKASSSGSSSSGNERQKEAEKRARRETDMRLAVLKAIIERPPLDYESLRHIAEHGFRSVGHDNQKRICKIYGWEMPGWNVPLKEIEPFTGEQLGGFILALSLVGECYVNSYSVIAAPKPLVASAARAGVDYERIRAGMIAAAKVKAKPKAKAAKPAAPAAPAKAAKTASVAKGKTEEGGKAKIEDGAAKAAATPAAAVPFTFPKGKA